MRMQPIVSSLVTCPDLPYFSTLFHKRHHFREKKFTEHKMCIVNFPTNLSEMFLTLRGIQQAITINVPVPVAARSKG